MPQLLGLFRLLSLALLRPLLVLFPYLLPRFPALLRPLDNINIGPNTTGFGPIAAPVFNIHVLAPGNREPPPRTAVPAPVSGTAAPICGPAFPDISIPIPEFVEESSCYHRGLDSMALWTLSSRFGLFVSPRTGLNWIAGATLLSRQ